jgi:all-trans-retinol 13,14-reductase
MSFTTTILLDVRNQMGIIIGVLVGYYLKKIFIDSQENASSKKWKSPFAENTRKPVAPLETDQSKRDEVMKRGDYYCFVIIPS